MNEDALRALIRETIARRLDRDASLDATPGQPLRSAHASHFRYLLPASDGPCLIEPSVACSHCGYCESHGH